MNPYFKNEMVTLYCGDSREVVAGLSLLDDWGMIIDPPWDIQIFVPPPMRKLVFCDGFRARDVFTLYGAPTWIFSWDCVSSWYTPNRPLRRVKHAFWYGPLTEYHAEGAHYGEPCGKKRVVTNTRGSYVFQPDQRGKHLADLFSSPITSLHSGGASHEKPLVWMKMLIGNCFNLCPVVIDPFAGSGAGVVAAVELGKRVIAVEIDELKCAHIVSRLNEKKQPLFQQAELEIVT